MFCPEFLGPTRPWDRALRQVWINLRRQSLLAVRDPTIFVSRMMIFLVACIFFG